MNKFNKEQEEYILVLYPLTNGNRAEASSLFEKKYGFFIDVSELTRKWNKSGFILKNPNEILAGLTKEILTEIHASCEGNIERMLEATGINYRKLKARCKEYNLPIDIEGYKRIHNKNKYSKYNTVYSIPSVGNNKTLSDS